MLYPVFLFSFSTHYICVCPPLFLSPRLETCPPSAVFSPTLTTIPASRPMLRSCLRRQWLDLAGMARTLTVREGGREAGRGREGADKSLPKLISFSHTFTHVHTHTHKIHPMHTHRFCPSLSPLFLSAPLDSMLRSLVLGAHGQYGSQATIDEAKAR